MAYASQVDHPVPPMPARISAWSIYRIFDTRDEDKIFRIGERDWFLPALEHRLRQFSKAEIAAKCDEANIPFAPIAHPEDLFEDPQLNQGGALLSVTMPNGKKVKLPKFPIEYEGAEVSNRLDPPEIGAHTSSLLQELGYSERQIETLHSQNIIRLS